MLSPVPGSDSSSGSGSGREAGRDGLLEGPPPAAFDVSAYWEEPPVPVREVRPNDPDFARQAGAEGTVLLKVLVGTDGRVKMVELAQSIPLLDAAAVATAREWVFKPALVSGHPVNVWVGLPMRFRLH
jgi:periplasmic protein TonB